MRTVRNILLLFSLGLAPTAHAQPDSTVFDNLLIQALQGNMTSVLSALDTLDDEALGPKRAAKKQMLLHRFRAQDEHYLFQTNDTAVIDIMNIYHLYWMGALLDDSVEEYEQGLIFNVTAHLRRYSREVRGKKSAWIRKHWNDLLQDHLKAHGCYSATGKTGQFYDLLLHMKETEVEYPVTTPEDTLQVKVIFMDSVICNGWEGYATLDTYYPGGWATNDALYCARDSYDLASENFTVSYLKHEGKHFADYKRFPKLQSADLEYRAKLVELSAAKEIMYGLIKFFLQNSAYDPANPHAYANFCVIRDLSRSLFGKEREEDIAAWKKLPIEDIHRASTALLLKNTRDLEAAGARSVKALIR
ncbi:MAG: hypothetical protein ABI432_13255 [Flavobacteriales bacterium]